MSLLVSGNYTRDIDFVINVTNALSNEEKTKIRIVHFEKLYNFFVDNFLIWINLLFQNVFWIL